MVNYKKTIRIPIPNKSYSTVEIGVDNAKSFHECNRRLEMELRRMGIEMDENLKKML